jgi:hypothetical protein
MISLVTINDKRLKTQWIVYKIKLGSAAVEIALSWLCQALNVFKSGVGLKTSVLEQSLKSWNHHSD